MYTGEDYSVLKHVVCSDGYSFVNFVDILFYWLTERRVLAGTLYL